MGCGSSTVVAPVETSTAQDYYEGHGFKLKARVQEQAKKETSNDVRKTDPTRDYEKPIQRYPKVNHSSLDEYHQDSNVIEKEPVIQEQKEREKSISSVESQTQQTHVSEKPVQRSPESSYSSIEDTQQYMNVVAREMAILQQAEKEHSSFSEEREAEQTGVSEKPTQRSPEKSQSSLEDYQQDTNVIAQGTELHEKVKLDAFSTDEVRQTDQTHGSEEPAQPSPEVSRTSLEDYEEFLDVLVPETTVQEQAKTEQFNDISETDQTHVSQEPSQSLEDFEEVLNVLVPETTVQERAIPEESNSNDFKEINQTHVSQDTQSLEDFEEVLNVLVPETTVQEQAKTEESNSNDFRETDQTHVSQEPAQISHEDSHTSLDDYQDDINFIAQETEDVSLSNEVKTEQEPIAAIPGLSDDAPRPNKLRKTQIVPNLEIFKDIDKHVEMTPASATSSVPQLAQYLRQTATDELQKIRAIYQWVSRNITYDVAGYLNLGGAQKQPCDPESVLRNRCSVCQGYSDLFLAICRESNVLAKTISGYSKGYSYKVGTVINTDTDTNHAWNVVFIHDEWRFVDCTWDAGHVGDNKFHRHEGEFYFLTDSDTFINDHFPYIKKDMVTSQQWQLLDTPIDLATFCKRAKIQKDAISYGIDFITHRDAIITVQNEVVIKFAAKAEPLKTAGAKLEDAGGHPHNRCVLVEQEGPTTYCVTVRPRQPGRYKLHLYGHQGEVTSLNNLVQYTLDCQTADPTAELFPELFGIWGTEPNYADFGFGDGVTAKSSFVSETGETEIRLPITEKVNVLGNLAHSDDANSEDKYLMLQQGQGELVIKVRMDRSGYYKLLIFAEKAGGTSYEKVMQYLVYCKSPVPNFKPFPLVYSIATSMEIALLEPTTKELPAETEVRFRVISSQLKTLKIGKSKCQKTGDQTWDVVVMTPASGAKFGIFGRVKDSTGKSLDGLYGFIIV